MDQGEVNDALEALIAGNEGPWRRVVAGLRRGTVTYTTTGLLLTIRAVPEGAVAELGAYLQGLRSRSGITQERLAEEVGIHQSSVIRQLQGRVLSSWGTVRLMVDAMGGDVHEARKLHEAAKAERKH